MPLIPLNRLAPRLRRSVEGLNLELEEVFVSEKCDDEDEVRALDYEIVQIVQTKIHPHNSHLFIKGKMI